MKLYHYSYRAVEKLYNKIQRDDADFKPKGFWVSCEDFETTWRDWCEGEEFNLHRLTHVHDVKLKRNAKLLHIKNAKGIDSFTEEYKARDGKFGGDLNRTGMFIDWARVAARYQGIIIAPYLWERRLHVGTSWYYGWDCASGCIWDVSAIQEVKLIRSSTHIGEAKDISVLVEERLNVMEDENDTAQKGQERVDRAADEVAEADGSDR